VDRLGDRPLRSARSPRGLPSDSRLAHGLMRIDDRAVCGCGDRRMPA
jgi:hypothetical protein